VVQEPYLRSLYVFLFFVVVFLSGSVKRSGESLNIG